MIECPREFLANRSARMISRRRISHHRRRRCRNAARACGRPIRFLPCSIIFYWVAAISTRASHSWNSTPVCVPRWEACIRDAALATRCWHWGRCNIWKSSRPTRHRPELPQTQGRVARDVEAARRADVGRLGSAYLDIEGRRPSVGAKSAWHFTGRHRGRVRVPTERCCTGRPSISTTTATA